MTIGPTIPTDNLVFLIDPANEKSFRGEPTTNLLPQPLFFETGYTKESWAGTVADNYAYAPDGTKTATLVDIDSGYFYKRNTNAPTFAISPGETFTFSCWVKDVSGGTQSNLGLGLWCYDNGSYLRTTSSETVSTDEWTRCTITYTAQAGESTFAFLFAGSATGCFSDKILIWHPQVEKLDHATPFVDGARGTTVATGGGVLDIAAGYEGETTENILYNESDKSLSFSTDAINYGDVLDIGTSDRTYSVWYKASSATPPASEFFLSKANDGARSYRSAIGINTSGNFLTVLRFSSNSYYDMNTTNPSKDTNWHNVVWVIDRDDQQHIYLDRVLLNSGDISDRSAEDLVLPSYYFKVGAYSQANAPSTDILPWQGNIGHVAAWDKALSGNEVKRVFNATRGRYGI